MMPNLSLAALIACLTISCAATKAETENPSIPQWLVRANENPEIRGIVVHVSPEVPDAENYFSLHSPHEVNYVFTNGSIHVLCFDFKRNKVEDRWTNLKDLPFDEADVVSAAEWTRRLKVMD